MKTVEQHMERVMEDARREIAESPCDCEVEIAVVEVQPDIYGTEYYHDRACKLMVVRQRRN